MGVNAALGGAVPFLSESSTSQGRSVTPPI